MALSMQKRNNVSFHGFKKIIALLTFLIYNDWLINYHLCFLKVRLPPEVNRILYVRNLPYKITSDEMYDIFGKYGAIRQIRVGNTLETRGTAYVVYEDIWDAKNACDHLSGFNVCNRYLVVLYYQATKAFKQQDLSAKQEELEKMKAKYNISSEDLRK